MQLHYCDGCNLRVDGADAVTVGDHVYCQACAAKAATGRAAAGTSGARPATTGAGGPRAGMRASGAVPRVSPAPGVTRHTPASGMFHRTPSGGAAHRSPASSGRLRVATAPPPTPVPAGEPVPTGAGAAAHRAPTTGVKLRAAAPAVSSGRQAAGPSGTRRVPGQPADAVRGSNTMTWALAAAGLGLALVGVLLMMRGQRAATAKPDDKTKTGTVDGKLPGDRTSGGATGDAGAGGKSEEKKETSKSGLSSTGGMEDIREGVAQRELDKIIEAEKGGQLSKLELYKRYQALVAAHGRTKAGQVATERATALTAHLSRPPDRPAAATPGLDLKIYEKSPGDVRLEGMSLAGLKSSGEKTVPNIDIADKGALAAVTGGRRDELVLRFSGYVEAPRDGNYTFITRSDDGSVVYIGDSLIVSNEGNHAMQDRSGDIPLVAGKHRFRVDYFQGGGDAGLIVSWAGPGIPPQPIPASALSHEPGK